MKFDHTPGPWKKCNANDGECPCGLIWASNGDFVIASATSSCREHESSNLMEGLKRASKEYLANTRLIAAAPEMLKALIDEYVIAKAHPANVSAMGRLKEIIESATGKPIEEILKIEEVNQ